MADSGCPDKFGGGEYIPHMQANITLITIIQQCHLVTPLQLYFSFNTAFTKVQVRATPNLWVTKHSDYVS